MLVRSFCNKFEELSSHPNNTCSTLSGDNVAQDATRKGNFFLFECLCINLAINSLPEPEGPVIKILLLLIDILLKSCLIFLIAGDLNFNSRNNLIPIDYLDSETEI